MVIYSKSVIGLFMGRSLMGFEFEDGGSNDCGGFTSTE
jgi:hypothetical protein